MKDTGGAGADKDEKANNIFFNSFFFLLSLQI